MKSKVQKFSGEGARPPPQTPSPLGRGTPPPKPYPLGASFASARAYGARVYLPLCPPPDPALPPWCRFLRSAHVVRAANEWKKCIFLKLYIMKKRSEATQTVVRRTHEQTETGAITVHCAQLSAQCENTAYVITRAAARDISRMSHKIIKHGCQSLHRAVSMNLLSVEYFDTVA